MEADAAGAAAEARPSAAPADDAAPRPLRILSWNVAALKALAGKENPPLTWMAGKLAELGSPDIVCLQEHKLARDALTTDVAVVDGYFAFFAHAKTSDAYSGVVTYVKAGVRVLAASAGVGCCAYCTSSRGSSSSSSSSSSGKGGGGQACPFACERFRDLWEEAVRGGRRSEKAATAADEGGDGAAEQHEEEAEALLQQLDAEGRAVLTDQGAFILINLYCPFNNPDDPSRAKYKHNFNVAVRTRCEALRAAGRAVVRDRVLLLVAID